MFEVAPHLPPAAVDISKTSVFKQKHYEIICLPEIIKCSAQKL